MKKQLLLFAVMVFVSFKTVSALHEHELTNKERIAHLKAQEGRFAKVTGQNERNMNSLKNHVPTFSKTTAKPKAGWLVKRQEKAAQESAAKAVRAGSRSRY